MAPKEHTIVQDIIGSYLGEHVGKVTLHIKDLSHDGLTISKSLLEAKGTEFPSVLCDVADMVLAGDLSSDIQLSSANVNISVEIGSID